MKEKKFYIGEGDDKVLLAFNLNVMAEIQSEYGSVQAWVGLLEDDSDNPIRGGEPDMKAFLTGFTLMLNEGVGIENDENSGEKIDYNRRQVGRMITKWGKDEVQKAMASAMSTATDDGETSKKELSKTTPTTA